MAAALLGLLSLSGCIKEDDADCGIALDFTYMKNVDRVNKFGVSVRSVDVFIFDHNGNFLEKHEAQATGGAQFLSNDYVMRLPRIKPGNYTFVVWGNLNNLFTISPLTVSTSPASINSATLNLNVEAGGKAPRTDNLTLFHGYQQPLEVKSNEPGIQKHTIDLIKFTNYIEVTITGIPVSGDNIDNIPIHCYITSENGSYRFDGTFANNNTVYYYPVVSVGSDLNSVTYRFYILRESLLSNSRLYITKDDGVEEAIELMEVDLVEKLVAIFGNTRNPKNTGDLDRDDEYYLDFELDYTNNTVTIFINDWVEIPSKPKPLK